MTRELPPCVIMFSRIQRGFFGIPSFFGEKAVHPAGVLADYVQTEIFSGRLTGALKNQLKAVTSLAPLHINPPVPQSSMVPAPEKDVPRPMVTKPVLSRAVTPAPSHL